MLITIVSTAIVLGVLIFVHEFGHFLMARRLGVTVLRFSLGFGPAIFTRKRGETEYCLSLIPLGGYVKMLGEEPEESVSELDMANSFSQQPVWKRFWIVFAGPLSNFLLAIGIFACLYVFAGMPEMTTEVGTVTAGSPAQAAGLEPGDKVLSIEGRVLKNWDDLSLTIQQLGSKPLVLEIERDSRRFAVTVEPEVRAVQNLFGESIQRPVIGITAAGKFEIRDVNPLAAVYYSLVQTWNLSKLFFLTVVKLIQRVLPMETIGGPLLIAQMAGQQAQEGVLNFLNFMALISVNLAILNLLPIPVLDGGHLFFFLLEAIRGRPIAIDKQAIAQKVGLFILLLLMVFVFYNDIMRLLPGGVKPPIP